MAMQPQPGMQPMAGFAMPQVVVPAGLPPGLAYLAGLDEIRIHQQLELLEGKHWHLDHWLAFLLLCEFFSDANGFQCRYKQRKNNQPDD